MCVCVLWQVQCLVSCAAGPETHTDAAAAELGSAHAVQEEVEGPGSGLGAQDTHGIPHRQPPILRPGEGGREGGLGLSSGSSPIVSVVCIKSTVISYGICVKFNYDTDMFVPFIDTIQKATGVGLTLARWERGCGWCRHGG